MTFQSIKIWLRILGRRLDMDVAAINSTNNSWKTTQTFKTLCYLYSFSTLFKREKDLQIDFNQNVFKIGLYTKNYRINTIAIWRAISHHYNNNENCTRLYLLHYSMIFIRLKLKQFGNNNLFQIGVCSVSFRTSMLTYFNSWLQLHAHKMSQFH